MPISYATLQIYDQYLTTYGSKRCSRYDTHDSKELKELYSSIQLKNRFAPVYLKKALLPRRFLMQFSSKNRLSLCTKR